MQLCLGDLGSQASNPISPLQAALATRENSLRVGIDSFWAPLAMFTTQDLALRLQFRERLVLNPEHLPHQGPVLLAPTHRARWDALASQTGDSGADPLTSYHQQSKGGKPA